jgi:hypothetical protein
MGLDMYFEKSTKVEEWEPKDYIKANNFINEINASNLQFDPKKIQLDHDVYPSHLDIKVKMINETQGYFYILKQVGYLRKANQIHNWLVKNIQDGIDQCQSVVFTKTKIIQLQTTCHVVLENFLVAPEKLPTKNGFFFGSSEYNFQYLEDVKDAYQICNEILSTTDFEKEIIIYHSSW